MNDGYTRGPADVGPSKAVLIAGLDDGREVAALLMGHPRIDLVGLFVLDEETGSAYSGYRSFRDIAAPPLLHETSNIHAEASVIESLEPDVVFVVGFSQVIPKVILDIPHLGVIGFHSAPLPERPGASPIIWAIAEGLTETAVTMFYLVEEIDAGDIIDANPITIEPGDHADKILEKANAATLDLLDRHLEGILDGTAPRRPQDRTRASYTRRRTPSDAEIDWSRPAEEIVNLVRALAPPYPRAHTYGGDGVPILIERARLASETDVPSSRFARRDQMNRRVLCVVAHPDDEVLGVGGTLARHAAAGGEVTVLVLSEGEMEKLPGTPRSDSRRAAAEAAANVLGTENLVLCDFPDQRLESVPFVELIKPIEEAVKAYRPQVVYTHHGGDANTDHQITFKVTYAACRPMSGIGSSVERLLAFETPSSTDQAPQVGDYVFSPTSFVDVEPVWHQKLKALECYPTEMIGGIHPRSYEYIEALARMRGGYAGVRLAEAFVIVRERILV